MRVKVKKYFYVLVMVTVIFSYGHKVLGQEKINISAGFGMPEFINIGLRFPLDQFQLGLSAGIFPADDESISAFSGDVRYYFGGSSNLSDRPPWYLKVGLNYLRDETESLIDKYTYFNTRLGREFNISGYVGIEIEAGAVFELSYERIRKQSPSSSWNLDFNPSVLPSAQIGLFYRIF